MIIGARDLREVESSNLIRVKVGKPRKARAGDWVCPFYITGLGGPAKYSAYGIDAIQALQMAFEGIRTELHKSGKQMTWVGGEPGDTGFARLLPTAFGPEFSQRLEQLLDQEIAQFAQTAETTHRKASALPKKKRGKG